MAKPTHPVAGQFSVFGLPSGRLQIILDEKRKQDAHDLEKFRLYPDSFRVAPTTQADLDEMEKRKEARK